MFRNFITPDRNLFYILLCGMMLIISLNINAQADKKYIRQGNREYGKDSFAESEILYRKAIDGNKKSPEAIFNIGDALYKQNKFEDAGKQFIENVNMSDDKNKKSAGFYNLGNSLLKANKVEESIAAYKNSLKLSPNSIEAKYNLAYAQDLLKQQQEQKEQQDKNGKEKEQDKNEQKKDSNDQKKDPEKDDQNKQQQQEGMSKDDAQRLLNALANDEKNVQEKVKLAKASKAKVKTLKNW